MACVSDTMEMINAATSAIASAETSAPQYSSVQVHRRRNTMFLKSVYWYKYGQDKGTSLEKQNNTSKETKNDAKDTSMEKSAIYRAAQMDLRERERCAEIVAAQNSLKRQKSVREYCILLRRI
ncbi:hypothetical protein E3N88_10042 [Mikania micrantha]|uniref:Uncharacterized protein n=1 Tax=Mikania micrantha TaxID=192012 RepID=A0A5N6P9C7_9ASTR|nr:hypothetical protein E3N88_10042 [Mikania micrantha]